MGLGTAELDRYHRDGFLVLEGFVDAASCDRLRARMDELLAEASMSRACAPCSAAATSATRQDDWFLDSGDKVRFFFEPDAFDDAGGLRQAKELSINKVGHALHDLDPVFATLLPRAGALPRSRRAVGFAAAAAAAVDVHLQAAADRRRGGLPPGQHLPAHRALELRRLLAGARGRQRDQWLHVGRARRPSAAAAPALRARGRRTRMETLDPSPLPIGRPDAARRPPRAR